MTQSSMTPSSTTQSGSHSLIHHPILTLLIGICMALTSVSARADRCADAPRLPLDRTVEIETDAAGTARFTLDAPTAGWLLIEAHAAAIDAAPVALTLYDTSCAPIAHPASILPIAGRAVVQIDAPGHLHLVVRAAGGAQSLRIDAWLTPADAVRLARQQDASGADPIPDEPVDEWDERRSATPRDASGADPIPDEPVDEWDERRSATPRDASGADPIPDEPVDEWDEQRARGQAPPIVEIPGVGIVWADGRWLDWCGGLRWLRRAQTLTCAPSVVVDRSMGLRLRRIDAQRGGWLRLDLRRPAHALVERDGAVRLHDGAGRPQAGDPTDGPIELPAGASYLRVMPNPDAAPGAEGLQLAFDVG